MRQRVLNLLIAIDQLAHVVITLGAANPDETISSALYRYERKGKIIGRIFRPVVDWMFSPFEDKHCYRSYKSELKSNIE